MALMTEEQRWAFELDGYILLPGPARRAGSGARHTRRSG